MRWKCITPFLTEIILQKMLFGSMSLPGSVSLTEPPDARFLKPELAYTHVTAVENNHDREVIDFPTRPVQSPKL